MGQPYCSYQKHTIMGSPQQLRLYIDYRKLNSLLSSLTLATGIKEGAFTLMPLPKIDELFTLLKGAKYLTALDLHSSYYQIKLGEESIPTSAFTTVFGKFEFLRLPLDNQKAQNSSSDLYTTFVDLTRPQIKGKAQDTWHTWMTYSSVVKWKKNI